MAKYLRCLQNRITIGVIVVHVLEKIGHARSYATARMFSATNTNFLFRLVDAVLGARK